MSERALPYMVHCMEVREGYSAKIAELEERCAKHAYNEEHLLVVLGQLRRRLRLRQAENVSNIEAAQGEFSRLRAELRHSRDACNALAGKACELDAEAEALRHEQDSLEEQVEAESQAAARQAFAEEAAACAGALSKEQACTSRLFSLERIYSELASVRREVEPLRSKAYEGAFAVQELEAKVASERRELCRGKWRDEMFERARSRTERRLLCDALVCFASRARSLRQFRVAWARGRERWAQSRLRHTLASWRRYLRRQRVVRGWCVSSERRRRSTVLKGWAWALELKRLETRTSSGVGRFWHKRLARHRRAAFARWAIIARGTAHRLEPLSCRFARRALARRSFARWRHVASGPSGAVRVACWHAFRVVRRRMLRRYFLRFVRHVSRSRTQRHLRLRFHRHVQLQRGLRGMLKAYAAVRLRRRIVALRLRFDRNWRQGPCRDMLRAWRRVQRRVAALAKLRRSQWSRYQTRLLRLALCGFCDLATLAGRVRAFRQKVCAERSKSVARNAVFPAWRQAVRRPMGLRMLQLRAQHHAAKSVFESWRLAMRALWRLRTVSHSCAEAYAARRRRAAWRLWRNRGRAQRRCRARGRLIACRHRLSSCQGALGAWRSVLRARAHEQRRSATDSLRGLEGFSCNVDETCRFATAGCGASQARRLPMPTQVPPMPARADRDLRWLLLLDEMQRLASETAEVEVTLEDVRAQRTTLERAREAQRHAAEALKAQVQELSDAEREASKMIEHRTELVEEDLSRVLREQMSLRGELRRIGEQVRYDRSYCELAEDRCAQLECRLEDSSRVCAELVDDRGRQIVELEAWSHMHATEVHCFEEALEHQRVFQRPVDGHADVGTGVARADGVAFAISHAPEGLGAPGRGIGT
mmetsp:Transcript_28070/g.77541  ORF Transcript_28070/g.77541 Transcript_28070/m.77541 type:complete len:878 (+) Transcript_28070:84-2717(+)